MVSFLLRQHLLAVSFAIALITVSFYFWMVMTLGYTALASLLTDNLSMSSVILVVETAAA